MKTKACKICGSSDIKIIQKEETTQVLFGSIEKYISAVCKCNICNELIDVTDDNIIEQAIIKSRINGVKNIFKYLSSHYKCDKFVGIELILEIRPFGILDKWKSNPEIVTSIEYALLICLRVLPKIY